VHNDIIKWGNQLAMPVTFNDAGEITSISIYHEGGIGNVLLGVYSDQDDNPSSRLGITASTAVNPAAGWQTIQLSTPVSVGSNQKVWLSWVFQIAPVTRYTAGTPGRAASLNTWANGMPTSFGPSTIAPNKYSIYCNYTANPNILKNANVPEISEPASVQTISNEDDKIKTNEFFAENFVKTNDFKLYPNPAKSFINVDYSDLPEPGTTIEIIDSSGRTLNKIGAESTSNRIDISQLPNGLYYVKSNNPKWSMTKKLIIVNY
jgi:hypothetical protein